MIDARNPRPLISGQAAPGLDQTDPGPTRRRTRSVLLRRALGAGALCAVPALGWAQDGAGAANAPRSSATPNEAMSAIETPAAAAPDAEAAAPESVVQLSEPTTRTEIVKTYAKRVLLPPGMKWTDAGGFDENVVTVTADDNTSLRLYAASPGVTQVDLLAVDAEGNPQTFSIEVLVTADARALQAAINRLFPGTAVEVYGLTDTSVVLRGWITRPEQVSQIVAVAGQYFPAENILNQMRVAAPQQVQLNVVFMEVQRSKAQEMGLNLSWFGESGFFSSTVGDVVPLAGIGGVGSGTTGIPLGGSPSLQFPAAAIANPTIAAGVVGASGVFQAFLRALREERLLKVLSEPVQVCSNGRPSYFQAGGEFPIPIPQGLGSVGIEYRPYGVELAAVPIMLGGGRVRLELAASVSDLDFSRGTTISGTTVPGLTQRQTNTQVELEFGKTLMIAGLIQNTQQAATQKTPILGELPWVGAAFRRVKFEEAETELVILVTPHPVAGLNPDDVPCGGPGRFSAAPTSRELFGLGLMEVPGADPCGPNSGPGCPPNVVGPCDTGCAAAPGGFVGPGIPAGGMDSQGFPPAYSDVPPTSSPYPSGVPFNPSGVPLSSPNLSLPQSIPGQPYPGQPSPGESYPSSPSRSSPSLSYPGSTTPSPALPSEPAPAPIPVEKDSGTDREASRFAPALGWNSLRSAMAPASYQTTPGTQAGASNVAPAGYETNEATATGFNRFGLGSFGAGRVTAPTPVRR
ncbi:type II and III secretion system protein family protein [Alienimonas chondri]|uniref:Type II/III secretion system secretin-like domain-containing protein n=1 Tax=Alienimonas chondri TaxID=2681879 RepID=A0ABX1VBB0_9PLAN|nr:hypothetical protein [Alienimonas chondri]NNJ25363.1 hypothetical protein [Alienimonas chondri]